MGLRLIYMVNEGHEGSMIERTIQLHQLLAGRFGRLVGLIVVVHIGCGVNSMLRFIFRFFSFTNKVPKPARVLVQACNQAERAYSS